MIPILIVIPYWERDRAQAIELCKIVAGLQAGHAGTLAHVMIVHRQDCKMDQQMIKIVSPRFNMMTYHSRSPFKGWPSGSNGMFSSSMIHIATSLKGRYECVYWMEPDAIPICPNWFWSLVEVWRKRPPNTWVVGCRSDCNGNGTGDHITGCAIYDPMIAKLMPEITRADRLAWDYEHRAKIVAHGQHTNLIENFYKQTNADAAILDRVNLGVVLMHGFKDISLVNHVKQKFKIA